MSCLDFNVIPRGLTIKKAPQTDNEGIYERSLISNREKTLRKASQLLLKHLKSYHKGVITLIRNEIKEEADRLRRLSDFGVSISYIYCLANQIFQHCGKYKRRKLEELIKNNKQHTPKKKEEKKNKKQRNMPSTVQANQDYSPKNRQ